MARAFSSDYFDLLDLPARFVLDREVLEARYRELSQKWHPDRHGRAPAAERAEMLQRATDLNEAYRTLKSESKRAEYLLKLRGIDVGAEVPDRRVVADPAFLGEIMELREELSAALHQAKTAAGDGGKVRALDDDVQKRMAVLRGSITGAFERLESTGDREALQEISKDLVAQRYYQRFRDEIEAYEEARAEAADANRCTIEEPHHEPVPDRRAG